MPETVVNISNVLSYLIRPPSEGGAVTVLLLHEGGQGGSFFKIAQSVGGRVTRACGVCASWFLREAVNLSIYK